MLDYFLYGAMGRLLIYLFQEFPLPARIEKIPFFSKLHKCDLCGGVYLFSALALVMHVDLFRELFYMPVMNEILTGMVTSFIVHLIRLGWHTKFDVIIG